MRKDVARVIWNLCASCGEPLVNSALTLTCLAELMIMSRSSVGIYVLLAASRLSVPLVRYESINPFETTNC